MKLRFTLLISAAALMGSTLSSHTVAASPASSPPLAAINVVDLNGKRHTIPDRAARATVVIFIAHDCPISCALLPEVDRIRKDNPGIPFYIVYAEPGLTEAVARQHAKQYGISSTCISAHWQNLVRWSNAHVTPEALVVTKSGSVAYEGRINNKYAGLGVYRATATSNELRNALDEISHGQSVRISKTTPVGCTIETMLLRGNG